jgi:predicted enzyme related to lactoylglutathione lyase
MSSTEHAIGALAWADLTIDGADAIRDFYKAVVGWSSTEVDMGGYSDYCLNRPEDGQPSAGVCWQRGVNLGLPRQWLVYFAVADLNASIRAVQSLGGKVLRPASSMGSFGVYSVIEDPAGAVAALIQQT